MSLTRQTSRRTLILQPSNAEVSTNQVYAARYEWRVDGELTLPVTTVIDSLKHTDAEFSIYRVDVSVNTGGTSQYRVVITSYDTAGLNPVVHVDEFVTITGDKNRVSVAVLDAAVPQNSSLELTLFEQTVGTPASDMTVTLIAEDFADLQPEREGHRILDEAETVFAQRPDLQFTGYGVEVIDDSLNNRTVVNVNQGFIGQMLQSMLTEAQMQTLYGTGWILADGRSVVGSTYETVTGFTTAPDARGIFLRSKNNGRADGNQDSAGERALGDYQADQFQGHWHNVGSSTQPVMNVRGSNPTGGPTDAADNAAGTSYFIDSATNAKTDGVNGTPRVGMETQSKNIAVNTFIKIN